MKSLIGNDREQYYYYAQDGIKISNLLASLFFFCKNKCRES